MDLIDRKIICELDANSRIPISQLAKKLRIGRNVAAYRIKNLEQNSVIRKYISTVNLGKLGYRTYRIYLKIQQNKISEKRFVKSLIENRSVIYCIKLEGYYDYSISIAVKNVRELDEFIMDLKSEFKDLVKEYLLSIVVYTKIFKANNLLLNSNPDIKMEKYSGEDTKINIDEKDKKILKIITQASNMSLIDIAKKSKLSVDVVNYRLKQLNKNLISSNRVIIDLNKLGYYTYGILLQLRNNTNKDISELVSWCAKKRNILFCSKRVGNYDFSLSVAITDINDFNNFINDLREQFGSIINSYTTLINSRVLKLNYFPF
jgi:Lrp/AsnC family transcriptional regulator, leucine-responsive regulatory protein